MFKKAFGFLYVCVLLLVLASPVSGQWVVDLNIPLYGQEVYNWCGAASAQMIMDGYPDPAYCVYISQSTIWNTIQAHNKPGEPVTWATDPQGLQYALQNLNEPPSGGWVLYAKPVREELMFDILYWMNSLHYGVPTLVRQGWHWVVIKGFQTDVAPVGGSNPVLEFITINNPWPPNQGVTTTMSGSAWYTNIDYWNGPVGAAGTWYDKYVAIIEPPPVPSGMVYAAVESRTGDVVITPQQAVDYADYWNKKLKLYKKDPAYALLKKSDKKVKPLDPILVREEINPNLEKGAAVPYYYIVPYALENEAEKKLTRICVLVNAFTGNFEEVSAYDEPLTYVDKNKAFEAVAYNLELTMEEMSTAQAEVVFTPNYFTCLRSKPFWRIEVNNEVRLVEIACPDQMVEMMQDPCVYDPVPPPPPPIYGK